MKLRFPNKIEKMLRYLKLKLLPKTLFFRTMMLIFVPLIVVQIVSIVAFFEGSWGKVGRKLSDNLSSQISFIIDTIGDKKGQEITRIVNVADKTFEIKVERFEGAKKVPAMAEVSKRNKMITNFLEKALVKEFPDAVTTVFIDEDQKDLVVFVDTKTSLFKFTTSTKNIFSTSLFGFMAWMVGTSVLLFLVAVLFLRIQVRSIAELAQVAEEFGRGIDNKNFKPYGSSEVRKAAIAFIKMKERIQKQISERTQMLAGVSHDLRTPLTRMKLQVELLKDNKDKAEFLSDISEMEKMLDGYLSFVSGECGEKSVFFDVNEMLLSIITKFRNKPALIRYATNDDVSAIQGREQAMKRALTNVISNAFDYGSNIAVKLESNNNKLEIAVEDDGPGIPKDKREEVFKAFYRLESSRNKETGGVGLGLSIAKDVVTSHGGKIELGESEMGGLRVLISIPL